ncbi:MAG: CDP-glycerol glycerophosphotransferase family protein [Microbacterium sp.]
MFGSAGLADGGLALQRFAADRGERTLWLTGRAGEGAEAPLRIRSVAKHSCVRVLATARARVIVITHGFGDVNRYAATGGVIVQLWHGIPLKRIGLDAAVTTASPSSRSRGASPHACWARCTGRTQHRIRVLLPRRRPVRGRLESAFGLDTFAACR